MNYNTAVNGSAPHYYPPQQLSSYNQNNWQQQAQQQPPWPGGEAGWNQAGINQPESQQPYQQFSNTYPPQPTNYAQYNGVEQHTVSGQPAAGGPSGSDQWRPAQGGPYPGQPAQAPYEVQPPLPSGDPEGGPPPLPPEEPHYQNGYGPAGTSGSQGYGAPQPPGQSSNALGPGPQNASHAQPGGNMPHAGGGPPYGGATADEWVNGAPPLPTEPPDSAPQPPPPAEQPSPYAQPPTSLAPPQPQPQHYANGHTPVAPQPTRHEYAGQHSGQWGGGAPGYGYQPPQHQYPAYAPPPTGSYNMGHQQYGGQAFVQQPMHYATPQWQQQPQQQYPPVGAWGLPAPAPGFGYAGQEQAPAVVQPWEGPPASGQPGLQQPPPVMEAVPPGVVVQGPGEERPLFDYDVMDARDLFLPPGRRKRPQYLCIILRGLPGSGKSRIAKRLREVEVEQGSEAPRVHALDDYFVTDVEKEVKEIDSSGKTKKRKVRDVEYCYEAELEGAYKKSLAKAVKKTVEDRQYRVVVVDAPNVRVSDFKELWTAAQRAGYEVYILQPLEMNPEVCFKRNVHGRTLKEIQSLAQAWEASPALYTLLDVSGLFQDDSGAAKNKASAINNVEMEAGSDDEAAAEPKEDDGLAILRSTRWASLDDEVPQEERASKRAAKRAATAAKGVASSTGSELRPVNRWASDAAVQPQKSGLRKSVRWADEVVHTGGFSIGGASKQQLVTIYVLEGLGPPPEEAPSHALSFADQLKADKVSEQQAFRSILFGGK